MDSPPADKQSLDRLKEKTAHLSVISNTGLVLMKFAVGFALGSVSIISEAIHSSMDLIAAVIAFFSVRKSAEPRMPAIRLGMASLRMSRASLKPCLSLWQPS